MRLSPRIQKKLVEQWLEMTNEKVENFHLAETDIEDLNWWKNNSFGEEPNTEMEFEMAAPLLPIEIEKRQKALLLAKLSGSGHC